MSQAMFKNHVLSSLSLLVVGAIVFTGCPASDSGNSITTGSAAGNDTARAEAANKAKELENATKIEAMRLANSKETGVSHDASLERIAALQAKQSESENLQRGEDSRAVAEANADAAKDGHQKELLGRVFQGGSAVVGTVLQSMSTSADKAAENSNKLAMVREEWSNRRGISKDELDSVNLREAKGDAKDEKNQILTENQTAMRKFIGSVKDDVAKVKDPLDKESAKLDKVNEYVLWKIKHPNDEPANIPFDIQARGDQAIADAGGSAARASNLIVTKKAAVDEAIAPLDANIRSLDRAFTDVNINPKDVGAQEQARLTGNSIINSLPTNTENAQRALKGAGSTATLPTGFDSKPNDKPAQEKINEDLAKAAENSNTSDLFYDTTYFSDSGLQDFNDSILDPDQANLVKAFGNVFKALKAAKLEFEQVKGEDGKYSIKYKSGMEDVRTKLKLAETAAEANSRAAIKNPDLMQRYNNSLELYTQVVKQVEAGQIKNLSALTNQASILSLPGMKNVGTFSSAGIDHSRSQKVGVISLGGEVISQAQNGSFSVAHNLDPGLNQVVFSGQSTGLTNGVTINFRDGSTTAKEVCVGNGCTIVTLGSP